MIVTILSEGEEAPAVRLPAYVDGERRRIDLGEYLGEGIVVLAFYPADFNPACTMQASDLGDLDLFTMQKDVSVFGVSPDSTYSHEAFAERYSLHVPLLSDRDGDAAAAYDVAMETELGERLVQRAVFVVDHRGTVQYAWATDDLEGEIDVAPVKQAVGDIGGDDTAAERYRVGHDNYVEGHEAFTEAMSEYEDREWMDARSGFEVAEPAFTAAADHFDTAVRFAETDDFETVVDRTEEKADTLAHAASWLADSADAFASGRGKQGSQYRDDAVAGQSAYDDASDQPDTVAGDLEMDIDAVDAEDEGSDDSEGSSVEGDTVEGDLEMDLDAVEELDEADPDEGGDTDGLGPDGPGADGERAGAEGGEADTDAAPIYRGGSAEGTDQSGAPGHEAVPDGPDHSGGSDDREADAESDDGEAVEELDLVDPTDGDDEEDSSDERADWDIPGR